MHFFFRRWRDRLKGYKQALIDNGIEIKGSLTYEVEEFTQINGIYATKLIINKLEEKNNNKNSYIIETKLIERESIRKV